MKAETSNCFIKNQYCAMLTGKFRYFFKKSCYRIVDIHWFENDCRNFIWELTKK